MAGDPQLPRFAGSIARRHEAGQFGSAPPTRGAHNALPWQHLSEVLHFVCELRGSTPAGAGAVGRWIPAFAGTTSVGCGGSALRSGEDGVGAAAVGVAP